MSHNQNYKNESYYPDEEINEDNKSAFMAEDLYTEGQEFMRGPTDTTDIVELERQKKQKQRIGMSIGSVVLLGAGILFATQVYEPGKPDETPTQTTKTNVSIPKNAKNPIQVQYKKAPKVGESLVTVKNERGTIVTDNGNSLMFQGKAINSANQPCQVIDPTDFCLAGQYKDTNETYDIYYLKDAAHSRMFEDVENFKPITNATSSASGTFTMPIANQQKVTGVLVNKNSSGWMFVAQGQGKNISTILQSAMIK